MLTQLVHHISINRPHTKSNKDRPPAALDLCYFWLLQFLALTNRGQVTFTLYCTHGHIVSWASSKCGPRNSVPIQYILVTFTPVHRAVYLWCVQLRHILVLSVTPQALRGVGEAIVSRFTEDRGGVRMERERKYRGIKDSWEDMKEAREDSCALRVRGDL